MHELQDAGLCVCHFVLFFNMQAAQVVIMILSQMVMVSPGTHLVNKS